MYASDRAGDTSTTTVAFTVVATIDPLTGAVNTFISGGQIDVSAGRSLLLKLEDAKQAGSREPDGRTRQAHGLQEPGLGAERRSDRAGCVEAACGGRRLRDQHAALAILGGGKPGRFAVRQSSAGRPQNKDMPLLQCAKPTRAFMSSASRSSARAPRQVRLQQLIGRCRLIACRRVALTVQADDVAVERSVKVPWAPAPGTEDTQKCQRLPRSGMVPCLGWPSPISRFSSATRWSLPLLSLALIRINTSHPSSLSMM